MRLKKLDKIRLVLMLPLSLALIVFGSVALSYTGSDHQTDLSTQLTSNFLNTDTEGVGAQSFLLLPSSLRDQTIASAPQPATPTPRPTGMQLSTPVPTNRPADSPLSCLSGISYTGSGSELTYNIQVNVIGQNSQTSLRIDFTPYITNSNIEIVEFTGNCSATSAGVFTCNNLSSGSQVFFKVINDYQGEVALKVTAEKRITTNNYETATCNSGFTISGINTPPSGMPGYVPSPPGSGSGSLPTPTVACNAMLEYCQDGKNLLDDVHNFPQSSSGSFESPVCTKKLSGDLDGECDAVGNRATYFESDSSIQIPLGSEAFFGSSIARPEYIRTLTAGENLCEEKPQTHGNYSFKIFSPSGEDVGINAGLCLPIKGDNVSGFAGINFRVTQDKTTTDPLVDNYRDVTFKLGTLSRQPQDVHLFGGVSPSLTEGDINWIDEATLSKEDYGGEGKAGRFGGGFLSGSINGAEGLCFMAKAANGRAVATFWDAAFVSTDANTCENALDHSDGIDRTCGGYACGNVEPTYDGNYYTDFDQEYYTFDLPAHWNANQCHYESESNGKDSPYGNLFVGLDLNSCDPNYRIADQRNINPSFDCGSKDNWTYGYAWTGGVKDFGLLQYLDCALGTLDDPEFKGTKSNPFFCSQVLRAYSNTSSINPEKNDDPAFWLRYSNTYPGLAVATQAEGQRQFWKVPLLGSAIGTNVINNKQIDELTIDPFLIGMRNSGSGLNNMVKYSMGEFADYVISQILRKEMHQYTESMITKNEVMVADLLAKGPVCGDIQGDVITKIHYGSESGESDRAIFGFADDLGSSEQMIEEKNIEITKNELCNLQFRGNRVEGAECTFLSPGSSLSKITFTEDNIGKSLIEAGYVSELTPTLPPPAPSGIPDESRSTCDPINLCGASFDCGKTMRDVYNQCVDSRDVDVITGNPFIRQELPNGWKDLQLFGVNKVMESTWYNEFIQYNHPVRHENIGIDVNQVVSIYDHQQPNCDNYRGGPKPAYCDDLPAKNEALQVCRRVSPYDCGCNERNFSTCLLSCPAHFKPPNLINTIGLGIEGDPLPTPSDPGEGRSVDTSIRAILDNSYPSFLEKFVKILEPKTYEGDGGLNYANGQIYKYNSGYVGGFHLANTSSDSQCSSVNINTKTGASQVRMENYYAYVGQIPRMNERIGFAATNNNDSDTVSQLEIHADPSSIAQFEEFITKGGEAHEHIAVPYCDLLTLDEKKACTESTDDSCDCLVRSCEQQLADKMTILNRYIPQFCEMLKEDGRPEFRYIFANPGCQKNLSEGFITNRFEPAFAKCKATPKTNLNFNCDPMANYLIDQGFDSPELRFAACDEITNTCRYDKFGVHLIHAPLQEANYERANNLGLGWKMEVISTDDEAVETAMVQSIESFQGTSVFRFCNADQGSDGAKVPDQGCMFRKEITGSTEESAKKVARMVMNVARRSTKKFAVSPINEPISEHWYGGDPNDVNHEDKFDTTMPAVSEFYLAFINELNTDQTVRSKIEVGGPTFNVTSFNHFDIFTETYNDFEHKDLVDFHTVTMYNNNDLPVEYRVMEDQFARVKEIITSKPIALNETGDFQRDLTRLEQSYTALGKESRLKYALMFNAFGGMSGDERTGALILSDEEIRQVLGGNKVCHGVQDNVCIAGGIEGLIVRAASAINGINPSTSAEVIYAIGSHEGFGSDITGNPNQLLKVDATLGSNDLNGDGSISPPCATIGVPGNCEYDVRGALQFQNFTFYGVTQRNYNAMKACTDAIGVDYSRKGPLDEGLKAHIEHEGGNYDSYEFSRMRVGDNVCAAALLIAELGNRETGNDVTPEMWKDFAESFVTDDGSNSLYRVAGRYLGVTEYETCSRGGQVYDYCNKVSGLAKDTFDNPSFGLQDNADCANQTSPSCLVSPLDPGFTVTQCYGETDKNGPLNAYCFEKFPELKLSNIEYGSTGFIHPGIDAVDTSASTPVYAAGPGTVHYAGVDESGSFNGGYGNYVVIKHEIEDGPPQYTRYAHLDSISVVTGDIVDHQTQVGVMGNTGNSRNKHLHFELLRAPQMSLNTILDPTDIFLRSRENPPTVCLSGDSLSFTQNECGVGPIDTTSPNVDSQKYQKIFATLETAIRNCRNDGLYESLGISSPYPYQKYCPITNVNALTSTCRADLAENYFPSNSAAGPLDVIVLSSKFLSSTSKYYPLINQIGSYYAATTEERFTLSDGTVLTYPNTLLINFDAIPQSLSTNELTRLWLHEFTHIDQAWIVYHNSGGGTALNEIHVTSGGFHTSSGRFFEACADEAPFISSLYEGKKRLCALRKETNNNTLINSACKGNLNSLNTLKNASSKFDKIFAGYGSSYQSGVIPEECNNLSAPIVTADGVEKIESDNFDIFKIQKSKYKPKIQKGYDKISGWASSADIVINASLFTNQDSDGYLKIDGVSHTTDSLYDDNTGACSPPRCGPEAELRGIITFNSSGNNLRIRRHREGDGFDINSYDNVLESIPLLIENGRFTTPNDPWTTHRPLSSFGYDSQYYYVIVTKQGVSSTYSQMREELRSVGLSLSFLLNFDGGGSTGLSVRSLDYLQDSDRQVPIVLTFDK